MGRLWPLAAELLVGWAVFVGLMHWFGVVHRDQQAREGRLNRREASLQAWSDDLEQVDIERAHRHRAAGVLLDRALGPTPTSDGGVR